MSVLTPNRLAFLALANEYCHAVENARQADRADFVADMLRLRSEEHTSELQSQR